VKILVTGTEGYIGALLAPMLMQNGYDVIGVDTGYYKAGWLYHGTPLTAKTLDKDIRLLSENDLDGIDAIVHMAELSNDPTGQLSPRITYEINHEGSVRLARIAKKAGIKRFVYTSSCSVYGVATEQLVDEESPVDPQTAYAKCKVMVEQDVAALADDTFSPTFLRNGTAYGPSPRMRFDIVLNNLAGYAWTTKEIKVLSDGTPWRPLVHVLDICKAIICVSAAPTKAIHNEIFNVGNSASNYQIKEIAEIVARVFPGCKLSFGQPNPDNRSYKVSFEKINRKLPEFKCDWNAEKGAAQLYKIFSTIDMSKDVFQAPTFTRLKMLQHLIETRQIDERFFWTYCGY